MRFLAGAAALLPAAAVFAGAAAFEQFVQLAERVLDRLLLPRTTGAGTGAGPTAALPHGARRGRKRHASGQIVAVYIIAQPVMRAGRHRAHLRQAVPALLDALLEAARGRTVALARQGLGQHLLAAQGFVVIHAAQAFVQGDDMLLEAARLFEFALLAQRRGQPQQHAEGIGMLGTKAPLARHGQRLLPA